MGMPELWQIPVTGIGVVAEPLTGKEIGYSTSQSVVVLQAGGVQLRVFQGVFSTSLVRNSGLNLNCTWSCAGLAGGSNVKLFRVLVPGIPEKVTDALPSKPPKGGNR